MELYITTILIMFASLSGVIFLIKGLSGWFDKNAKFIIAFSAGIFAVVTFNLVIESFEFGSSWFVPLLSIIAGFSFFHVLEKMFPEIHHHDSEDNDICLHSKRKVIWGDALHNIGDGVLLALAFSVDVKVGLVAALGIFVHEFVQEINEFSILRLSGYSVKKALFVNFLVSTTIFIGVFIGTYITQDPTFISVLFGLAAGAFLHLISTDLVPHSIQNSQKDKKYFLYILLVVAGILSIFAVNLAGGHEHEDGHMDEDHAHEEHNDADVHIDEHQDDIHVQDVTI